MIEADSIYILRLWDARQEPIKLTTSFTPKF